jgi:hypothetical protein
MHSRKTQPRGWVFSSLLEDTYPANVPAHSDGVTFKPSRQMVVLILFDFSILDWEAAFSELTLFSPSLCLLAND